MYPAYAIAQTCRRAGCGATFHVAASQVGRTIFCSPACKTLHHARPCAWAKCGQPVTRHTKATYCSERCREAAKHARYTGRDDALPAGAMRPRFRARRSTSEFANCKTTRPEYPATLTVRCQSCYGITTGPWGAPCAHCGAAHETTTNRVA